MLTQNTQNPTHKSKLRWVIALSSLPMLAVISAFGIIPQQSPQPGFFQQTQETIALPDVAPVNSDQAVFWRSERIQRGDTVSGLLHRLGVEDESVVNYLRTSQLTSSLMQSSNKLIQAEIRADGTLLSLRYRSGNTLLITVKRDGDQFSISRQESPIEKQTVIRSGLIQSSLFAATDTAGISDSVANQLADIFSGDIDFHRDLRKGDKFSVIYEMDTSHGEPLNTGKILAAEFINQGHQYRALYHETEPGNGKYYSPDGKSMRKAFLRSPLEFSRVSSGFKLSRLHPVLNTWRSHKGVDYAAPLGTKVRATSDGVVSFIGQQGGYGNVIMIDHQGKYATVYGHLSKFATGLRRGQRVSQGEHIGNVGKTGMATGPHLHYEFKINGQQHDPLRVALPDAKPISPAHRLQFQAATTSLNDQLDMITGKRMAMAQ